MVIQFGSESVREYARARGYSQVFQQAGVEVINPGCGACIGCGPGVSDTKEQVTVSAINRNFTGRSGPGRLYLASPLTVAASAVEGRIASWWPGKFGGKTSPQQRETRTAR
jgi:3-isopropylmalate/(R)-2-methylmalate dehydratase large subunit